MSIANFIKMALFSLCVLLFIHIFPYSVCADSFPLSHVVNNTAYAHYSIENTHRKITPSNTVTILLASQRTSSQVCFMQYVPNADHPELLMVRAPAYKDSSNKYKFILSPPLFVRSIDMSIPLPLIHAEAYHSNEPVFIVVKDQDQNSNPNALEKVEVTITISSLNEKEVLQLTETDVNTGIFTGYIQISVSPPFQYDGILSADHDVKAVVTYADVADSSDRATCSALIDPLGKIFDSRAGLPVNGAAIRIINVDTGLPAIIFGDDGVSIFPSVVISGGNVKDSSGKEYVFSPGKYQFPFISPGNYRFEVIPPPEFSFPSTVPTSAMESIPGAPYAIKTGSRGESFRVNPGSPVFIDIPLDASQNNLFIQKTASKSLATPGDFIHYKISIENLNGAVSIQDVVVNDFLPPGFRYQTGSLTINGKPAGDPLLSADGRTMRFSPGNLKAGAQVYLSYVTEVAAGAKMGSAENLASAYGSGGEISNIARSTIQIQEDFMRSKSIIVGKVIAENKNQPIEEKIQKNPDHSGKSQEVYSDDKGIEGVRIYLEDGAYVITDKDGMYHFEGIEQGVHVLQLDVDSLPEKYQLQAGKNDRFADHANSQFVDVKGGTVWRADFKVAPREPLTRESDVQITSTRQAESDLITMETTGSLPEKKVGAPVSEPRHIQNESFYNQAWIESAKPGLEWLSPVEGYLPNIPSLKAVIKHHPQDRLTLLLDGNEVNMLNFETMKKNRAGSVAVSFWRGIDLHEGNNHFELIVNDANDREIGHLRRAIHYSDIPVKAELIKENSVLIADGKNPPVIAIRLTDKDGYPAREDVIGEFSVEPPYTFLQRSALYQNLQFSGLASDRPRFTVGENGIALLTLEPTVTSGEIIVHIHLANHEHEIRAWLTPVTRDWILVGLAEGTLGYNTIKAHTEYIPETEDSLYKDGRLAFFSKGKVKGEWLLTLAYDSDKKTIKEKGLYQKINPDTYYAIYGDSTQQEYEAASSEKLYLKLERNQFYALYGDYDTGLTITELSRYNRSLNGLKATMHAEHYGFNLFLSETNQGFIKDELQGNGTSGLYYLSRKNLIRNSEKVAIEIRNRFRSEILLSSTKLTRYLDYNIDYETGTIYFKKPVMSKDEQLNPIIIVIDYESYDDRDTSYNYGGRGAVKLMDKNIEIGATHIHEGRKGGEGNLNGLDVIYDISEKIQVKSEIAFTDTDFAGIERKGSAYLAHIRHDSEKIGATLYMRKQGIGFGLGQQSNSEAGTEKLGFDLSHKFNKQLSLDGQAYRQTNFATGAERKVFDAKSTYERKNYSLHTGLLFAHDEVNEGKMNQSNQVTAGGNYRIIDDRLNLSLDHYQSLGSNNESADFPTRTILGADYILSKATTLFGTHEIANGERTDSQISRIGMKGTPWDGAEMHTALEQNFKENGRRTFANLGLKQIWQINEQWSVDGSIDRTQTITSRKDTSFNTYMSALSGENDDFIAVSLGSNFKRRKWSWTSRIERRFSDTEKKWGLFTGILGEPRQGLGLSLSAQLFTTELVAEQKKCAGDIRLGLVYRPMDSEWTTLNRLDLFFEDEHSANYWIESWRIVNNFNVNYAYNENFQVSLQHGLKYVTETIDNKRYQGFTDLIGFEGCYDISKWMDICVHASILHSWNSDQFDYSYGPSIGVNLYKNLWTSIGYNVDGFIDKDFSIANYTSQGPYIKIRFKIDQENIKDINIFSKDSV